MASNKGVASALARADRLYLANRPRDALSVLERVLAKDPRCYEALVTAGELYLYWGEDLGVPDLDAARRAAELFERAIAVDPEMVDAYAEKSAAHVHLGEWVRALECANAGLYLLDREPSAGLPKGVWINIGETLYQTKALALQYLGRQDLVQDVLGEGLRRFPDSEYLQQVAEELAPAGRGEAAEDA